MYDIYKFFIQTPLDTTVKSFERSVFPLYKTLHTIARMRNSYRSNVHDNTLITWLCTPFIVINAKRVFIENFEPFEIVEQ